MTILRWIGFIPAGLVVGFVFAILLDWWYTSSVGGPSCVPLVPHILAGAVIGACQVLIGAFICPKRDVGAIVMMIIVAGNWGVFGLLLTVFAFMDDELGAWKAVEMGAFTVSAVVVAITSGMAILNEEREG